MSDVKWWQLVDWAGAIAFVLALGISISMIAAAVAMIFNRDALGSQGATILSTLFGASIGAVATYLGQYGQSKLVNESKIKTPTRQAE